MTLSVAGKSVIVTGAANGIGRAIARHFLDRGARVMFVDHHEAQLLADLGPDAHDSGSHLRWFAGDLREKLVVNNVIAATLDAFERIDVLINAARVFAPSAPLSPEGDQVEALWSQNVLTALRLSQQVAQRMIDSPEVQAGEPSFGAIINLSSIATRLSQPDLLAWSMASAATEAMTRNLALTLAPYQIRVNCIAMGSLLSTSLQEALKSDPEGREDMRKHTPLGRIGAPHEVAEVAQFLASEGAGFITGQVLPVDGGRSLLDPVRSRAH